MYGMSTDATQRITGQTLNNMVGSQVLVSHSQTVNLHATFDLGIIITQIFLNRKASLLKERIPSKE